MKRKPQPTGGPGTGNPTGAIAQKKRVKKYAPEIADRRVQFKNLIHARNKEKEK